jgi:hypothetical protein
MQIVALRECKAPDHEAEGLLMLRSTETEGLTQGIHTSDHSTNLTHPSRHIFRAVYRLTSGATLLETKLSGSLYLKGA